MLNKKLFTVGCAAGSMALFSLIACSSDSSSDKLTGATIDPDAIAQNLSSSSHPGSSDANSANFDFPEIAFKTAATSVVALDGGELKTFEAENGVSAECTGDEKSYISKIQIDADGVVKNSLELKNFGSGCDRVLAEFVASCHSQAVVYNGKDDKKTCDENGNVKSYCYDDRAVTTIPADSTVNFNDIVRNLSTFSEELCNDVYKNAKTKTGKFSTLSSTSRDFSSSSDFVETSPDPVDSEFECDLKTGKNCDKDDFKIDTSYVPVVDPRQELPSSSAEGIDASANRSFIIKPNVETLNVSETERIVLDSLAMAFPSKSVVSEHNDLRVSEAARYYAFGSSSEKYYVGPVSTRCDVDVFRDKFGLESSAHWLSGYYNLRYLYNTILQYSDSVIVYLVAGSMESESVETLFRTECESVAGSFYNYPSKGMVNNVGMACAVKNFTGVTLDAILGQQASLCENMYVTLVHPVQD
ncbi:MAG: hypothetical protein J6W54_03045 [Fibrobacter sp.]|uniref:hypothetical protein n=1 Tax=Fibrobacter sp. TaxID=35828 RepID=UPI001B28ED44|nr:hypothetical protein [Fibrobacter sp.]MBO7060061.1 hypothetical protein [Fibrobacter sp.]